MTVRNDTITSRVAMVVAGAGIALVGLLASVPVADAQEDPVSGDPRASAFAGNVTTCADAGLTGSDITTQLTSSTTPDERLLTITDAPDGIMVTGIVVKGGDNYNLYIPGERELSTTPPWAALHAPLVGADNQNVPAISHWFACGIEATATTPPATTPPATTPPATTPPATTLPATTLPPTTAPPTTAPATTLPPTTPPATTAPATTAPATTPPATSPMPPAATSSSAPAPIVPSSTPPVAGTGGALAKTGVATWPMIGAGAALIAGGCGLAFLARRRRGSSTSADS